jgi:DNA-binding beta-propeller fold protein YncE
MIPTRRNGMPGRKAMAITRVAFLGVVSFCAAAQNRGADCNSLAKEAVRYVKLPGHPFSTISSADGCWLFVSLSSSSPLEVNGVAVLRRNGNGDIQLLRVVPVESGPSGMIMTHNGRVLIVADDEFVVFLDVKRMTSAGSDPILGFLRDQRDAGSVYVNVTRDDKYLFVSDEGATSISVIELEKARTNGFDEKAVIGKIPVGEAPIALTFSPDEKLLYTTSELAAKDWGWPAKCKPEGEDPATAKIERPEGAIVIVDVEKAKSDPVNAVRARVPAGCSPVRMGITEDGASVWITVRNNDAVAGYDTSKLLNDSEHARIGWVPVGRAPVGLTITRGGRYVVITNSNRFASNANTAQTLTVIDPKRAADGIAAVVGSIEAGAFPREFGSSPDGKTIFLANYLSNTLEVIDAEHLPVKPTPTPGQQPK